MDMPHQNLKALVDLAKYYLSFPSQVMQSLAVTVSSLISVSLSDQIALSESLSKIR
jgi:hypothetical protein